MKKILSLILVFLLSFSMAFARGKLQNEDSKSLAEIQAAGGTAAQLLNDTKIYVTSGGVNNQLSQSITNGDFLIPQSDASLDLGSPSKRIRNAYQSGNSTAASLTLTASVSGSTKIVSAATASTSLTYVLPANGGTNNYILTTNGGSQTVTTSWVSPASLISFFSPQTAIVRYSGTRTSFSSTPSTMPLTSIDGESNGASISSNQLTIPAGTWLIDWNVMIYFSSGQSATTRLYSITGSAYVQDGTVLSGTGVYLNSSGAYSVTTAVPLTFEFRAVGSGTCYIGDTQSAPFNTFAFIKVTKNH